VHDSPTANFNRFERKRSPMATARTSVFKIHFFGKRKNSFRVDFSYCAFTQTQQLYSKTPFALAIVHRKFLSPSGRVTCFQHANTF
jgi:hypothetical protein